MLLTKQTAPPFPRFLINLKRRTRSAPYLCTYSMTTSHVPSVLPSLTTITSNEYCLRCVINHSRHESSIGRTKDKFEKTENHYTAFVHQAKYLLDIVWALTSVLFIVRGHYDRQFDGVIIGQMWKFDLFTVFVGEVTFFVVPRLIRVGTFVRNELPVD